MPFIYLQQKHIRKNMKKTFVLTHPKIKYDRLIEGTKRDVKKYIKREQNKKLPENVDYWDFDCKYGDTEKKAATIHISEINKCIDGAEKLQLESFYLEILVKPGYRTKKS
jgi:tRNA U34 5-carboxymethylaminomethyl modifying enzyme MnmG/GidA